MPPALCEIHLRPDRPGPALRVGRPSSRRRAPGTRPRRSAPAPPAPAPPPAGRRRASAGHRAHRAGWTRRADAAGQADARKEGGARGCDLALAAISCCSAWRTSGRASTSDAGQQQALEVGHLGAQGRLVRGGVHAQVGEEQPARAGQLAAVLQHHPHRGAAGLGGPGRAAGEGTAQRQRLGGRRGEIDVDRARLADRIRIRQHLVALRRRCGLRLGERSLGAVDRGAVRRGVAPP